MKSAVFTILILFNAVILISGCKESADITGPEKGSGKIVTQTRSVDKYTGVNLYKVGNVHIIQDSQESVRVEADDNVIDKVITTVQNGTLMVGLDGGNYSDVTVNIYVSLETIDRILLDGSGNITAHNSIQSDTLDCVLTGAGNITLLGQGSLFNCSLNGAGNISAENYKSKSCKVSLKGTGNCYVNASDKLDAFLSGVGSIYYYGDPKYIITTKTGVGQIIKK